MKISVFGGEIFYIYLIWRVFVMLSHGKQANGVSPNEVRLYS